MFNICPESVLRAWKMLIAWLYSNGTPKNIIQARERGAHHRIAEEMEMNASTSEIK